MNPPDLRHALEVEAAGIEPSPDALRAIRTAGAARRRRHGRLAGAGVGALAAAVVAAAVLLAAGSHPSRVDVTKPPPATTLPAPSPGTAVPAAPTTSAAPPPTVAGRVTVAQQIARGRSYVGYDLAYGRLVVVDAATGKTVDLLANEAALSDITVTADGGTVWSASTGRVDCSGTVLRLSTAAGSQPQPVAAGSHPAVRRDGRYVAYEVGGPGCTVPARLAVLDTSTGQTATTPVAPPAVAGGVAAITRLPETVVIDSVAWLPDGTLAVTSELGTGNTTVRVVDPAQLPPSVAAAPEMPLPYPAAQLQLCGTVGRDVVALRQLGGGTSALLLITPAGQVARTVTTGTFAAAAVDPTGERVAVVVPGSGSAQPPGSDFLVEIVSVSSGLGAQRGVSITDVAW